MQAERVSAASCALPRNREENRVALLAVDRHLYGEICAVRKIAGNLKTHRVDSNASGRTAGVQGIEGSAVARNNRGGVSQSVPAIFVERVPVGRRQHIWAEAGAKHAHDIAGVSG